MDNMGGVDCMDWGACSDSSVHVVYLAHIVHGGCRRQVPGATAHHILQDHVFGRIYMRSPWGNLIIHGAGVLKPVIIFYPLRPEAALTRRGAGAVERA